MRFAARRWDAARAEEQQKAAGERKQSEQEGLFVGRSCSNEPLSFRPSSAAQLSEMWGERGRETDGQMDLQRRPHSRTAKWGKRKIRRDSEK